METPKEKFDPLHTDLRRLLERGARAIDDHLLYNEPIRRINLRPFERASISGEKLQQFRRDFPNPKILRKIEKLLKGRVANKLSNNGDMIVSRFGDPWDWRHAEVNIRARCFELLECAGVAWDAVYKDGWLEEGWLFVEAGETGAAVFHLDDFTIARPDSILSQRRWVWRWVFVDPEHRCQGILTRRLSALESRYGNFAIDQPNPASIALLRKAGVFDRHEIVHVCRHPKLPYEH